MACVRQGGDNPPCSGVSAGALCPILDAVLRDSARLEPVMKRRARVIRGGGENDLRVIFCRQDKLAEEGGTGGCDKGSPVCRRLILGAGAWPSLQHLQSKNQEA